MSIPAYKRLTVALAITCVGLLALSGFLYDRYWSLSIRVLWACQKRFEFHTVRAHALERDNPADAVGYLRNLVIAYPSVIVYPAGIKKDTNSPLDKMVEAERAFAVRSIIQHLRAKTGEDLGEDPHTWIERYWPE